MKSPLKAPHSGGSLWKGLLITASILTCWIQVTPAQRDAVSVVPNPPYGTVGSSATLDIWGFSENTFSYTWYRKSLENNNQIIFYNVFTGVQEPANIRQRVLPNGSLLIPNLTLGDTDDYIVQFLNPKSTKIIIARGHLSVYDKFPGKGNCSSICIRFIIGTMIGILAGVSFIGVFIYILYFRKTGRTSKHHLSEKKHSASKHGEDNTLYENTSSVLPAQGLGLSSISEDLHENFYQTLDNTRMNIYDIINPWDNPQAQEREE